MAVFPKLWTIVGKKWRGKDSEIFFKEKSDAEYWELDDGITSLVFVFLRLRNTCQTQKTGAVIIFVIIPRGNLKQWTHDLFLTVSHPIHILSHSVTDIHGHWLYGTNLDVLDEYMRIKHHWSCVRAGDFFFPCFFCKAEYSLGLLVTTLKGERYCMTKKVAIVFVRLCGITSVCRIFCSTEQCQQEELAGFSNKGKIGMTIGQIGKKQGYM